MVIKELPLGTEINTTPVNHKIENIERYANGSYYYFVSQPLAGKLSLATPKTVACTDYNITKAKKTSGNGIYFITPNLTDGNFAIGTDGNLKTKFTVRYNNEETLFQGNDTWISSLNNYSSYKVLSYQTSPTSSSAIGSYNIGHNGANSAVVGAIYNIKLNNGSSYRVALAMVCT